MPSSGDAERELNQILGLPDPSAMWLSPEAHRCSGCGLYNLQYKSVDCVPLCLVRFWDPVVPGGVIAQKPGFQKSALSQMCACFEPPDLVVEPSAVRFTRPSGQL